jgi:hypothetical protein
MVCITLILDVQVMLIPGLIGERSEAEMTLLAYADRLSFCTLFSRSGRWLF